MSELRCIDPDLRVIWDNRIKVYLIVRPAPVNVFRRGFIVEARMQQMNMRSLEILKKAVWEREHLYETPDRWFDHLDRQEQERADKKAKEGYEMRVDFLKKAYKLSKSKTFS